MTRSVLAALALVAMALAASITVAQAQPPAGGAALFAASGTLDTTPAPPAASTPDTAAPAAAPVFAPVFAIVGQGWG